MKKFFYLVLSYSPLPYLVRFLVKLKSPRFLIQLIIKKYFIETLKVDISEVEHPVTHYKTILEFFTRRLKPGVRPLSLRKGKGEKVEQVISPVDGVVMSYGQVTDGKIIQIKNITYSLENLVGKDVAEGFYGGDYITLYLSPRDYHRIHHPVGGEINNVFSYSGRLLPVNHFSLEHFREVFSRNRRVVVAYNIDSKKKYRRSSYNKTRSKGLSCLSCWVGALNVGEMRIYFDQEFYSKANKEKVNSRERLNRSYSSMRIERGGEAGCFELGSTVILIFSHHTIRWMPMVSNNKFFRVGEPIARIRSKAL